jgi:ATP-binding protein involved in chromosome partitioning
VTSGGLSLADIFKDVKLKLITISGKGGVGKSFVSASVAIGLAMRGYSVGVLDADVYGPTVPKMLGVASRPLQVDEEDKKILPVEGPLGIRVVSVDFLLPGDDVAVIWRAPMLNKVLRELLANVKWGSIDALVVDLPPGTGDAPLTVAQSLHGAIDGSIIVTIPTEISRRIVIKAIDFSRRLRIRVAGIVENMCCFRCPGDGKLYYIFGRDIGKRVAEEAGVPFLGGIPIDPELSQYLDGGRLHEFMSRDSETSRAILLAVDRVIEMYRDRLAK